MREVLADGVVDEEEQKELDMLKQKLISPEDLTGLDQKKLSKVKAMSMF